MSPGHKRHSRKTAIAANTVIQEALRKGKEQTSILNNPAKPAEALSKFEIVSRPPRHPDAGVRGNDGIFVVATMLASVD